MKVSEKKKKVIVSTLSNLETLQEELVKVNHALLTAVGAEYQMLAHWAIVVRDKITAISKR